jgi:hypothetical protein
LDKERICLIASASSSASSLRLSALASSFGFVVHKCSLSCGVTSSTTSLSSTMTGDERSDFHGTFNVSRPTVPYLMAIGRFSDASASARSTRSRSSTSPLHTPNDN